MAGHPSCGPSPIEVDLVVETHENEETNPVVTKVQVRGVSRGGEDIPKEAGIIGKIAIFRIGKTFHRNIPRSRGYRQVYTQSNDGVCIWMKFLKPKVALRRRVK